MNKKVSKKKVAKKKVSKKLASKKEPDLLAPEINGQKIIERNYERNGRAPKINWGEEYRGWSSRQKISYLEKFAHSMNHACDLMQKERNALALTCQSQEQQLLEFIENRGRANVAVRAQLDADQKEKQNLYAEIVSLKRQVKSLNAQIKALGYGDND